MELRHEHCTFRRITKVLDAPWRPVGWVMTALAVLEGAG
jgi:hypothetical protein